VIILGLNAYHADSAACVLRDGRLIAAAEEERFTRVKHCAGFPAQAIRYCLREAQATLSDVAVVALNQDARANLLKKLTYLATTRPDAALVIDRIRNKRKRAGVESELGRCFPGEGFRGEIHNVEHHVAHLGSAYLVSPFAQALAVSVDGFGDFASAAWGPGSEAGIRADGRIYFPHSLGIFYQALTQYLGFPRYGDEYKVMGLAPYGEPRFIAEMRRLVRLRDDGAYELGLEYFRHHSDKIEYEWESGEPAVGALYSSALQELLGDPRKDGEELTQRHRDIARSVQAMYEEAFFHLLNRLHSRYRAEALALAGGCAMNSVANGKIYANTPFRKLYVHSAAGDAGGAIGAAFVAWSERNGANKPFFMDHAYWGPAFSDEEIKGALEERSAEIEAAHCEVVKVADEGELCSRTAAAIGDGAIVGWFQGRMEWGPRALGNRSILCDPRRADMKDVLNLKIKRRESFRPFAPSILREAVRDWFEADDDVPFMMQVYPVRADKRALIPAVTHVDGSGRLHTVTRSANPRYYRLIEAFAQRSGVPLVLNTSFNENEPVVCSPQEALECFLRTRMDVLVLGNRLLRRGNGP
jgi:carbamoyltransferase